MSLVLTEEQELLKQTAAEFVAEKAPVTHLRALRDGKDETGFSRALWREMGELGWTGITFPEEYGGSGLGYAELGVVLEECGRTLVPEPFLSTVLLAGSAIALGGNDIQRKEVLPGICSGESVAAFAFQEHGRFDPYAIATRAEIAGKGYRLRGSKCFVLDGHAADHLLVAARTAGQTGERDGITLFLLSPKADGIRIERSLLVDSRSAAVITFDDAVAEESQVLGSVHRGADVLDAVFDRATIGLCAEMLGTLCEAYERTVEYLKTREQFDVVIGSFQALKHRAAQMFCEVELSRSVVLEALRAIDDEREDVATLASAAKARCSDTAGLVTREGIQMHGGIGMTDEEDIGLFLKRARTAELTLGDASYHRDRFARLQEF